MEQPLVCAVMLTRDRLEMAARAERAFQAQTYEPKRLLVLDSGSKAKTLLYRVTDNTVKVDVTSLDVRTGKEFTIGHLRNAANAFAFEKVWKREPDIFVHWDDDDVSHPLRLAEQVQQLTSAGSNIVCVGYHTVLFWDTRGVTGEAWLYAHPDPRYCVGASMAYWRRAWESCEFDDAPHEDQRWWLRNADACHGASACLSYANTLYIVPRLICQIHGGNTSTAYRPAAMQGAREWRRVPQFDSYCEKVMHL